VHGRGANVPRASCVTVENHLHHAYRKLGVRSRTQLARQLDPSARQLE